VELENVAFNQKDAWSGNDITARVGFLELDANNISISKQEVLLNTLHVRNPYFSSLSYPGKFVDTTSTVFNWKVKVNELTVTDGRFRIDKGTYVPEVSYFDGNHIDLSRLNLKAENVSLAGSNLSGEGGFICC
jgi:hypothetical protein